MNREQILDRLKLNKSFFNSLGVIKIGLFGSYLRGEETEESDIDILVKMEETGKLYFRMGQLQYFLEEEFGKKIDLIRDTEDEPIYKSREAKEHFEKIKKEILESVLYV